uniref:hypothetical protein n=1 Tax=Kitasatospora indigofera TaxID=67307 RepID=UPI002F90CF99
MTDRDSVYNDASYNITSVPSWKAPPLHGAYAPNAKLTPRVMVGIGAGVVVLAATGMFAWSNYASAQADAEVRKAQIALDASRLDLERQKQQAEQAAAGGEESAAQKARREAVQACVNKAGGAWNAITDCGKAYPVVATAGMASTASTAADDTASGGFNSGVGLAVLGVAGGAATVGWAKKRFARP